MTSVVRSSKSLNVIRSSLIHFSGPALCVTSLSSANTSCLPCFLYLKPQHTVLTDMRHATWGALRLPRSCRRLESITITSTFRAQCGRAQEKHQHDAHSKYISILEASKAESAQTEVTICISRHSSPGIGAPDWYLTIAA